MTIQLQDEGTLDTVVRVNGVEHRVSQETAADYRESDGSFSRDGLEEMVRDLELDDEDELNEQDGGRWVNTPNGWIYE